MSSESRPSLEINADYDIIQTRSEQAKLNGFVVTFLVSLRTVFASIIARKESPRADPVEKASWRETWSSWRLASRDLAWLSCRTRFSKSLTHRRIGIFKVEPDNSKVEKDMLIRSHPSLSTWIYVHLR